MNGRDGRVVDPDLLVRTARRMASRWCGSRADAEDVAQEAILCLLRQAEPPANVDAWLFVVTRRLTFRELTRSNTQLTAETAFTHGRGNADADRDLLLDIDTILARLGQRDRNLLLSVTEGRSSCEIASDFGCAVRDVGQMVARARRKAARIRHRR